jgi:hypothetical protein
MEFRGMLRRVRLSLVASLFLALLGGPVLSVVPAAMPVALTVPASAMAVASSEGVALDGVPDAVQAAGGTIYQSTAYQSTAYQSTAYLSTAYRSTVAPEGAAVSRGAQLADSAVRPIGGPVTGALGAILVLLLLLAAPAVRSRGIRLISLVSGAVAGPRAPPAVA